MTGTILTFYSFKGGVGRSFILANIAVLLARWGHRVLTIDWDLEAPGLDRYFAPLIEPPSDGVVDLVDDFRTGVDRPTSQRVTKVNVDELGGVDLIAAGRRNASYPGRVQEIDWARLYEQGFAEFLERCRVRWAAEYDFVLVDSRTGISDIGGICTAQLPDRLVVVFTANEQSMEGALDVAARADQARDRMPYDRAQLMVLPVLSRLDNRVEYQRAELWYEKCLKLTAPLFRNWLVRSVSETLILRHLIVPYVSYWSFGEQLPVREERVPAADQIAFALETLAAIVAHRFDRTDLLADNRDAYVAESRRPPGEFQLDILVSCPRASLDVATELVSELKALGVKADLSWSSDPGFLARARDSARHLCLVVDGQVSRWQATEAEQFLRHTLADSDRRLFPVLTPSANAWDLPGFLRNLSQIKLGQNTRPQDAARQLYASVLNRPFVSPGDPKREAYQEAAAALRQLPASLPSRSRWQMILHTVLAMADAVRADDTGMLRDLTGALEHLGRTHAAPDSHDLEPPARVRSAVDDLLDRIDGRIGGSEK